MRMLCSKLDRIMGLPSMTWTSPRSGTTTGRIPSGIWIDDPFLTKAVLNPAIVHRDVLTEAFKKCGITPPKYAVSTRGWLRFLAYALKRAQSNHPHNVKWKPLADAYIAIQVASKLEE